MQPLACGTAEDGSLNSFIASPWTCLGDISPQLRLTTDGVRLTTEGQTHSVHAFVHSRQMPLAATATFKPP
jgi:hypothetical protein